MRKTDVLIIGAGQAGIVLSYCLQQFGIDHIVVEKDRPFSAWYQRWDSFHMNTANWMNILPGGAPHFVPGMTDNGRASKADAIRYFEKYAEQVRAPILQDEIMQLNPALPRVAFSSSEISASTATQKHWIAQGRRHAYQSRFVVVCSGAHVKPRLPAWAARIPAGVGQMTVPQYRNPAQIATARVLVVGNGSSGVQIADELARSGRFERIVLSCGSTKHFPWRVFGISIHTLARITRFFDISVASGIGRHLLARRYSSDPATPPTPAYLRRRLGVILKPKVSGYEAGKCLFVDGTELEADALTILWCSGLGPDFSFLSNTLRQAVLDSHGLPKHHRGVSVLPGLYFLGLRLQWTLGSHILYGIAKDAHYLAGVIKEKMQPGTAAK